MCELLGISANVPTDIRFSFSALARRGGETGPHRDGWGITFYEGKASRSFHEPRPSAHSDIARLIRSYPIKSRIVIAHVRRANRGRVALENTHPFRRELWGRSFAFAHNGQLKGIKKWRLSTFKPIGTTDSEHAFCWMLDHLRSRFADLPPVDRLDPIIAELCRSLGELGTFNMLFSDGRSLYCYCSKRLTYLTRRAPFGTATLIDEDLRVDFAAETTPNDLVSVIATRPLTRDETWFDVAPSTFLVFRRGELVVRTA
jgi:glutamine amidotransferase